MQKLVILVLVLTFNFQALAKEAVHDLSKNRLIDEQLLAASNLGLPPRSFDIENFKKILKNGANPNAKDRWARSPIFYLSRAWSYHFEPTSGDHQKLLEGVELLLDSGAEINVSDIVGESPLFVTIRWGGYYAGVKGKEFDISKYFDLISKSGKLNVDIPTRQGSTPLSMALSYKLRDLVLKLVKMGADPTRTDNRGATLLFGATSDLELFDFLLGLVDPIVQKKMVLAKMNSGTTLLHSAARNLNVDVIKKVLKFGINVNSSNVDEETPIAGVVEIMNAKTVSEEKRIKAKRVYQLLISHGAKPISNLPFPIVCHARNRGLLSTSKLEAIVKKCSVTSVDQLLPLLPSSYLSHYSLVYAPRGIQKGDEEFPRVILIGKDAKFVMGFNGSPKFEGNNTLEIMEYKEAGSVRSFEFREMIFENGAVSVSEINPPKCLGCHNSKVPRPNWDTYFLYPGFFGSEEGIIFSKENEKYKKFILNSHKGRYANLLPQSERRDRFEWGPQFNTGFLNYHFDFRFENLYSKVISSWLSTQPQLRPFRFAILGAISCQDPIEDFVPTHLNSKFKIKSKDLYDENVRLHIEEFKERIERHMKLIGGEPEGEFTYQAFSGAWPNHGRSFEKKRVSKLRYIVENLGLEFPTSMIFSRQKSFVFSTFLSLEFVVWNDLLDAKKPSDKSVRSIYESALSKLKYETQYMGLFMGSDGSGPQNPEGPKTLCPTLKRLSLSQLSQIRSI